MEPAKLFVDTNIFVALKDKNDSTHMRALQLLERIENSQIPLFTSSDVIGETLTVMAMKLGKTAANDFLAGYTTSGIEEIFVDEEMHAQARALFRQITSKNVSFIDCSSVIVMRQKQIQTIFTFDRDFKKFGLSLFGD